MYCFLLAILKGRTTRFRLPKDTTTEWFEFFSLPLESCLNAEKCVFLKEQPKLYEVYEVISEAVKAESIWNKAEGKGEVKWGGRAD
ncbi:hypothetical protein PM082_010523 [Marasmius tenuissimus]|nr:hypothetical protein PM082_010523 [Marasmius tenuissimus]